MPVVGYHQQYCMLWFDEHWWTLLKKFVYRGVRVNSIGCRGMAVGTKANIFHSFLGLCWYGEAKWCRWQKNIGIGRFTDRINICLVSLVGCDFNEVNGVTRYGSNHNFCDNFWDTGYVWVYTSYSLTELKTGAGREGGYFVLISCIVWKRYRSWGKYLHVHVQLVCDTGIRGGYRGTRTI